MEAAVPITVLMRDPGCGEMIRASRSFKIARSADPSEVSGARNVFVLALASGLSEVAAYVREANRRHLLRGLLVRADVEARWIAQMLDRADLRTLRAVLVHREPDVPRRVLHAWRLGAQTELIADAVIVRDKLVVLSCAMQRFEVSFDAVPVLTAIPAAARGRFEIASDGSYLRWPDADVHLDLETIRVALDPATRQRVLADKLRRDQRLGRAVARLRKEKGLRQSDLKGVSPRQVRRIEGGEFVPRTRTLEKLAAAHRMSLSEYLDALAKGS